MMDDETITALAKGMAPFVRECVADAVFKIGLDRQDVTLPPILAEQTACAMRLLQELPPIMPSEKAVVLPPRVLRIERDEQGALVPIYEESSP